MQRLTVWVAAVLLVVGPPCVWGDEGEAEEGDWDVDVDLGDVLRVLSRERRALKQNPAIAGFSWEERVKLIRLHNEKRRLVGATGMRHITWDAELERLAQGWVGDCSHSGHSSNTYRRTTTFTYIGENLWGGTGGYTEEGIVVAWDQEKNYYFSSNFSCQDGKACGHYTQVAWASTYVIGCGIKFCDPWYSVGCMYGPGGNIGGQDPFILGTACTACPSAASVCDTGLCRPDLTCGNKVCKNSGQLLTDVCECNCTGTGFSGDTCQSTGSAAIRVASSVMTTSLLALAVLALRQY